MGKIEDEDEEFASEMRSQNPNASFLSLNDRAGTPINASETAFSRPRSGTATPSRRSRAPSVQSMIQSNLPYGARPHRPSWNTRDFSPVGADDREGTPFTAIDMNRTVPDDEPEAAPAATKRRSKRLSGSNSLPKSVDPSMSTDSLRIGGDVSTRDTIGNVPAPTTRPRAGTHGSLRNSRTGTPVHGLGEMGDLFDPAPSSQRSSKFPLTPAQEMDEWGSPKQSREG